MPAFISRREASLSALTARFSPWGWSRIAFTESAAFMKSPYEVLHFAPQRGFPPPPAILGSLPPLLPDSLLRRCPHAHSSAPRWPQRPALQPEGASHQTAAPGWRGWAGRGWGSAGTGEPGAGAEAEPTVSRRMESPNSLPRLM